MAVFPKGVNIGTISGGIVNFGGAVCIAPITASQTPSSSSGNTGSAGKTNNGLSNTNKIGAATGSSSTIVGKGAPARYTSANTGGTISGLSATDKQMISDIIGFLGTML